MSDLLVITAVGLGTYAMRAVFLVRRGKSVRERSNPMLQLVAPAVLAAIFGQLGGIIRTVGSKTPDFILATVIINRIHPVAIF